MNLNELSKEYRRNPGTWQRWVNDYFTNCVNETPELKELRDYVEKNIWGFGERSFYWLWKLVIDEMENDFTFLEVGVFRGQTLALTAKVAEMANKIAFIAGITPLNSTGGHWESDYEDDIKKIHDDFNLWNPVLMKSLSNNPDLLKSLEGGEFDIIYIDGGHEYETVKQDLANYTIMAKQYLIIDDCCNDIEMPQGYFAGIESVTKAVNEWEATQTEFELMFNVMHVKLYKRK